MIKQFLVAVLLGGISMFGFSQSDIETALQNILSQPQYRNASVGIQIKDIDSEQSVFEFNPNKLMIPASTLKIVTSAAAFEMLGAGYRFKTQIGYVGELKENNEIKGDLVIIGGGDPTLGSMYFSNSESNSHFIDLWVQKIKTAGIKRINGDIILDASIYDSEKVPSTWIWGDIGNYYGAGANAFTCYDNLFRITFNSPERTGDLTSIISTFPKIEGLDITNEVVSSEINRDRAYVFGSPFDKTRVIRGTIPKGRKNFTIKAAVHQPEEILAFELITDLAKEGIFISGDIKFQKTDKTKFHTIYVHESPTLAEIIKVLNHESVNLFAEHLVKQIAVEKTGIGSRETGIELIKNFFKSKEVIKDELFMEDGSGLSHFNAISVDQITSILNFMVKKSDNKEAFLNSLPNAGNGTLSGFSTEFFPENTLKAKSGSMTRVRCYAGFLQTNSGREIAFTVMFNQFSGSSSNLVKEIENLLFTIKQFGS